MMNSTMILVAGCAGVALRLASVPPAQPPAGTHVTVNEEILAGRATYQYSVANGGDRPITIVTIGVDALSGDFVLTAAPSGWEPDRAVPGPNVGAPAGWTSTVIATEDSNNIAIAWRAGSRAAIAPGHTLRGFRVTLPRPTASYKASDWETTDDLAGATRGKLQEVRSARPRASNDGSDRRQVVDAVAKGTLAFVFAFAGGSGK